MGRCWANLSPWSSEPLLTTKRNPSPSTLVKGRCWANLSPWSSETMLVLGWSVLYCLLFCTSQCPHLHNRVWGLHFASYICHIRSFKCRTHSTTHSGIEQCHLRHSHKYSPSCHGKWFFEKRAFRQVHLFALAWMDKLIFWILHFFMLEMAQNGYKLFVLFWLTFLVHVHYKLCFQ